MSKLLQVYNRYLSKYPISVQIAQTSLLMGSGDVIAQFIIEKKSWEQYSFKRTSQFLLVGGILVGPALTLWYRALARKFGTVGTPAVAVKKVACDQAFFAPTFLGAFIATLGTVQGKSLENIKNELDDKYFDILTSNYFVWPAANLINFYFTPLQYQVLFVNFVALFWNSYVSWKTQKALKIPSVLSQITRKE